MTLILNRIEHDVNDFKEFIDMLKDIEGTDLIVDILTSMYFSFSFIRAI